METTLRMFYARALFVLCFFFLAFMVAFAGVAFAQDAVTVDQIAAPPAVPYTGLAGYADTGLAGLAGGLALTILTAIIRIWNLLPVWVTSNIDLKQTMDSLHWRENIQKAAYDGLIHATIKLKIDPASIKSWEEKNAFLSMAGQFLNRFDPDIKALYDKDGNGIPDVLEIALAKIAPQTAMIAPPDPMAAPQGFMAAPEASRRGVKPRSTTVDVEALAAKFSRRPKGTVTQ